MMALIGLAWKFRYVLAVLAIIGAFCGAVLWHKGAVQRFGAERYAAGELAERSEWQNELARLKAEQERQRNADEQSIREIATALADEKAARRDEQDSFDMAITDLENEDAKAGTANSFDPRVLRIVR